jgi:hypothetical protein
MDRGRRIVRVLASSLVLSLVAALAPACSRRQPDTAADEQLFALPAWCGKGGPRRPWTSWAADRGRDPTGNGVCGVRLPAAPADDDAGVCVELRDNRVASAEIRGGDERRSLGSPPIDDWSPVQIGSEVVLVRLEGRTLRARSVDGSSALDGPCFFR